MMNGYYVENGFEYWHDGNEWYSRGITAVFLYNDGKREWYADGLLHRLDGPALIRPDGHREWWVNGLLHRLDGPAVIGSDGFQTWWIDGRRHRQDGPAVIRADGEMEWWIDGEWITRSHLSQLNLRAFPKTGFTDEQVTVLRLMR